MQHQPITNGQVKLLDSQHRRVEFGAHMSVFSPLFETREQLRVTWCDRVEIDLASGARRQALLRQGGLSMRTDSCEVRGSAPAARLRLSSAWSDVACAPRARQWLAWLAWLLILLQPAVAAATGRPFVVRTADEATYRAAWRATESQAWPHGPVRGIAVPHHAPALHLLALGFRVAQRSGFQPRRVVLLAPDHFKRSGQPFASSLRNHATVLGLVRTDGAAVRRLLRHAEIENSDLLAWEHGIGVVLPMLRLAFPGVPVVPLTISIGSRPMHWQALAQALKALDDGHTLFVQSTDFSHYLPLVEALQRDQRSLHLLADGRPEVLATLEQPRQIDSAGAMVVMASHLGQHHQAQAVVLAHADSVSLRATDAQSTTTYMVHAWVQGRATRRVLLPPGADLRHLCVVGDTYFGRFVQRWLADPVRRERVRLALQARLQGCPLLVNLEGVMLNAAPASAGLESPPRLAMPVQLTLDWLRSLNVVAAGLANNHALDFGPTVLQETAQALRNAGILPLLHGQPQNWQGWRLLALGDFDNPPRGGQELVGPEALQALAGPPTLALLHWGQEYQNQPGAREEQLSQALAAAGARWIVGAHSHRASARLQTLEGGRSLLAYSLGNFVFDQRAPAASGAVLQISCFASGVCATRQLPLPDIFELGRR